MKRLLAFEILILIIIVILNVMNYITYGHGLGDVYIDIVIIFSILFIWLIYTITKVNIKLIMTIYFLLLVLIIFKITLYRGSEYKWNGNIFYNN